MFGRIEFFRFLIVTAALIATGTDLSIGRIYNKFNLIVALVGISSSVYFLGWSGLGGSFLAVILGLALYGWMFMLRFMGAGDVKYLMALGACGGVYYVLQVAVLAVLMGGVLSLLVLLVKGRLMNFISRVYYFILSIVVPELEIDLPRIDRSMTIPFGVPLSLAAVWVAFR